MEQTTTHAPKKRNIILPIILALVIIGGATFGIKEYLYYQHNVDTEDAHVDADISPVNARVSGYITSVRFGDNQHVNAGDTIATIDTRDLSVHLDQATGALSSAEAAITVNQANVASAEAMVEAAKSGIAVAEARYTKAQHDLKRTEPLLASGATTQQVLDAITAERDAAAAAVQGAKSQLVVAERQVATAQQQVAAATAQLAVKRADVDLAKLQLSYTAVIAPTSGVVNKRTIQPGQLVQPGQTLVSIISDSTVYVSANFKETQLEHMKIGQKVDLEVDAYPDSIFEGTVASFSPGTGSAFSLLPSDNASGNFVKVVQRVPVKITVRGAGGRGLLKPGMSVKTVVHLD